MTSAKAGLPTLSAIIPTVGRPSLSTLLLELVAQLGPEDEVLVIGDGPQPEAARMSAGIDPRVRYHEFGPTALWGHPQRNWAMEMAKGSHLVSFDDDDAVRPDALDRIRDGAKRHPDRPLVFRMHHGPMILWRERALALGNVSTQMIVVPNIKGRLGRWGSRYEGDFDFLRDTVRLYPNQERSIVWKEDTIALHGIGGRDPRTGVSLARITRAMFQGMEGDARAPGSEIAAHMPTLYLLARHRCFGHVVELGVGRGWSTAALLGGVLDGGSRLVSYDVDPETKSNVLRALGASESELSSLQWEFRQKSSTQAADDFPDESVSLWFLDTVHSLDATRAELAAWLPKMHREGVMCGHDYFLHEHSDYRHYSRVKQAVDEFAAANSLRFRLQVYPHDHGLFVLWPRDQGRP